MRACPRRPYRTPALVLLAGTLAAGAAAGDEDLDALKRGCAAGTVKDCERLALLALTQPGGSTSDLYRSLGPVFEQARQVFERACGRGDLTRSGCVGVGRMYEARVPEDIAEALPFYQRACDGGLAEGCTHLGNAYTSGLDARVPWDPRRAVSAFERACAAGAAGGCSLAARVLEGASTVDEQVVRQVPRDMARAASLYAKGCDLGAMADCVRLGELHEEGTGVPRDLKRTAALYRKACESGDDSLPLTVCSRLALLYESGSGVPRDLARAAALYKKGCQQGIALDCEALEKLGKGRPRN